MAKSESNNNAKKKTGYLDKELEELKLDEDECNFKSLTLSQDTQPTIDVEK